MSESPQHRIPALDGLRAIAVLLVMTFHCNNGYNWQHRTGEIWWSFLSAGWSGVDLFFVLSGFLITGILFKSVGDRHYFRNFYIRRVLRIFPLYYGILILILVIPPAVGLFHSVPNFPEIVRRQAWLWGFSANLYMSYKNSFVALDSAFFLFNAFWSLAVEEHFYMVWPMVVLRLERINLMKICLGLLIFAPMLRTFLMLYGLHWVAAYQFTLCRVDSLAAGAFVALAMQGNADALRKWSPKMVFASSLLLTALAFHQGSFGFPSLLTQSISHTFFAVFFAGLIAIVSLNMEPSMVKYLEWKPLREIGKVSYGMYIFHTVFEPELNRIAPTSMLDMGRWSEVPAALIHTTVAISITFAVAWLSFRYYETPINKFKRLFYPDTNSGCGVVSGRESRLEIA